MLSLQSHLWTMVRGYRRVAKEGPLAEAIQAIREKQLPPKKSVNGRRHPGQKSSSSNNGFSLSAALDRLRSQVTSPKDHRIVYLNLQCNLSKDLVNGIRSVLSLPWPVSQNARILCFCSPQQYAMAKEAGASLVGGADLIEPLMKGELNFDRVIASTEMMGTVAKVARILGPKGLMPTIRTGTITDQLVPAIRAALSNVPLRVDKTTGLATLPLAKAQAPAQQATDNFAAILAHLQQYAAQIKGGRFIRKAYLVMANQKAVPLETAAFWKPQARRLANSELIKKLESLRATTAQ